jgi:A1 cistron-splicing factor AAR2
VFFLSITKDLITSTPNIQWSVHSSNASEYKRYYPTSLVKRKRAQTRIVSRATVRTRTSITTSFGQILRPSIDAKVIIMQLSSKQAEYHYENGAFLVVSDLPEGSQVGLDGEDLLAGQFMGYKMIPSGLHLFTHSAPTSSDAPMSMPIRHGLIRVLRSRQTLVLNYSAEEEELIPNLSDAQTGEEVETVLTRDQLKTLDPNLGIYPLQRHSLWQGLIGTVNGDDVEELLGKSGKLDSLMDSPADDEVTKGQPLKKAEHVAEGVSFLKFAAFDLKRCWAADAVGAEVTKYSQDKSWLWRNVVTTQFNSGM